LVEFSPHLQISTTFPSLWRPEQYRDRPRTFPIQSADNSRPSNFQSSSRSCTRNSSLGVIYTLYTRSLPHDKSSAPRFSTKLLSHLDQARTPQDQLNRQPVCQVLVSCRRQEKLRQPYPPENSSAGSCEARIDSDSRHRTTEEEIATQRALDLFPGSALYSGVCLSAIGNSTSHSEGQVLNGSVLDCRPSRGTARRPLIGDCITSCCSRRPSRHINFLDWWIVI
jgi:hypothetical protein